jgi:preprotein translocase subunit YajC
MFHLALAAPPQAGQNSNPLLSFVPLLVIIVVFYLLLMRPQIQRQKKHQQMLNELQKGDNIVTIGGIHGTIAVIKKTTLLIEVAKGIRIEINKSAVSGLAGKEDETSPGAPQIDIVE